MKIWAFVAIVFILCGSYLLWFEGRLDHEEKLSYLKAGYCYQIVAPESYQHSASWGWAKCRGTK